MVTTFNKKDLIEFGNYLLSEERTNRVLNHPMTTKENIQSRLQEVSHADLENWIGSKNEFKCITAVGQMCLESLDPEEFSAWEKVRDGLMRTRNSLKRLKKN